MSSERESRRSVSATQRVRNWWSLPGDERYKRIVRKISGPGRWMKKWSCWPFRFGIGSLGESFLAYHPDSHLYYNAYPEMREVWPRFIQGCHTPNAGDHVRLWTLILMIRQVLDDGIEGEFAELGVFRGNTAAVLAAFAARAHRRVQLFDTFAGFDGRDLDGIDAGTDQHFRNTSTQYVGNVIGPSVTACDFFPGYFPDSLRPEHASMRFAVVSLDCDLYKPMKAGLEFFYPRLSVGGVIFIHDYSSRTWKGVKQAVDEVLAPQGEWPILVADKSGTAIIRRSR